ncbi:MAG TPA: DUF4082 domain-containing protein [Longimicrobium sp.]|nr:DUF4082 domain-containing protein [Longimicrobium sp.]
MNHAIFAAAAVLALGACSDTGLGVQPRTPSDGPGRMIIWPKRDSIFTTQVPASVLSAAPGWQVGTVFTTDDTVKVIAFRFYKAPGEIGLHTARLFTSSGTLLGSRSFTNETPWGWQKTSLTAPFNISPGTYVVTVNTNAYQVKTGAYFLYNGPIVRHHLTATGGSYGQPIHSFPSSGSSSAFFVDMIYDSPW